jgi:hypothetical protein
VGIISFLYRKTLNSQAAQGLCEITLMEEFPKMNKLSNSNMLSSSVQAMVSDKSLVDRLKGTVVWEYDSMACPQMIVQLYKRLMKIIYEPDEHLQKKYCGGGA